MAKITPKEIPLSGKLSKYNDGATIGNNDLKELVNLRYRDAYPVKIGGMTKATSAALATGINAAFHFRKPNPAESHLVVAGANGNLYEDDGLVAVPGQATMESTPLWTATAGAQDGRFASTPQEGMIYCNGKDTMFWGGDRFRVAKFLVRNSESSVYDFTDQVTNDLATSDQLATLYTTTSTVDNTVVKALYPFDADTNDQSGNNHNLTAYGTADVSTAAKKFGAGSCYLDGNGSYLEISDSDTSADFNFSTSGIFTIDYWIYPLDVAGIRYIFSHSNDGQNTIKMWIGSTGTGSLKCALLQYSTVQISLDAPVGTIPANTWTHVQVVENGDNWYLFVNGSLCDTVDDSANHYRLLNYTGKFLIGGPYSPTAEPTKCFYGYIDEFRISNNARDVQSFAPATAPSTAAYATTWYVGSILPIDAVAFELDTPNPLPAYCEAITGEQYTTGRWTSMAITDGTAKLTTDGLLTFPFDPANELAVPFYIEKEYLYWYRFVMQGSLDFSGTKVKRVLVRIPPQKLKELWDGNERQVSSFLFKNIAGGYQDGTSRVFDPDFEYADYYSYIAFRVTGDDPHFQRITSTTEFLIGFPEQMAGIGIMVDGAKCNAASVSMDVYYFNGSGYTLVNGKNDGTENNGAPLGKAGVVSWTPPPLNQEFVQTSFTTKLKSKEVALSSYGTGFSALRTLPAGISSVDFDNALGAAKESISPEIPLYYYKFIFSGDLTDDINISYVYGIPAPKPIRGFLVPAHHQGRLVLANNYGNKRNLLAISNVMTPNVFNGTDSFWTEVGGGDPIVAMRPLFLRYSSVVSDLLLIAKEKETYMMDGTGETENPFKIIRVSDKIGCVAPGTMVSVPVGTPDVTGQRRQGTIWQATHGIVIFDGINTPTVISKDIAGYFDPTHADYLGASILTTARGFYDPVFNEYHWIVPDRLEFAYDLERQKWYQIDRYTKLLNGGFTVTGDAGIQYSYGFTSTGYLHRLDYGSTFDGDPIIPSFQTPDLAPLDNRIAYDSWINGYKLTCKAGSETVTVSYFQDTSNTGVSLASFSNAASGKRLRDHVEDVRLGPAIFHGLRFVNAEPLMLVLYFETTQPDIIDV